MKKSEIPYYDDFLSPAIKEHLLKEAKPVKGVKGLVEVGVGGGLENEASLNFLCDLYSEVKDELALVLNRRIRDRKFIDDRTKACRVFNQDLKRDFLSPDYKTIFGMEDTEGRIVLGPKTKDYCRSNGNKIAPLPEFLQGNHVTLFGPPDNAKLSINAMNAYHRRLKDEPQIVRELLATHESVPKWGADDEDSKTPLRQDLISAGENLSKCLDGTLSLDDGKKYELEKEKISLPIKRFPGLALPCFFLFYKNNTIPLHLYDFALHLFQNWHNKKALAFYVPKLENEEEARYIRIMLEKAEALLKKKHASYEIGSIRVMIVLENPRAVFRANEMMDELYPYFAGASLGWHDYLASTARLFKEDHNYRIPVKADPDIVIKYIKASHDLLANVVGPRGGIKVGGMYGILPISNDLMGPSFQLTMKGYIRDVVTQLKRELTGFWVAHPDFVRLGLALVEAWKFHKNGDSKKLEALVTSLLDTNYHKEMLDFIHGQDIHGLDQSDPLYPRSLIVADIKESHFIANNHPDEIRYNVFQSLQYITDWLSGNGCVALPAQVSGVPVRVMDDLATAERSRWEVWHEIYHGRFLVEDFLKIAHEELHFIRKDLSNDKKIVQVKWDDRTAKWYPVAMNLMVKLMTDKEPVEFATQLLLPFTLDTIRKSDNPWSAVVNMDSNKFLIREDVKKFNYYFEMCGSFRFAKSMMANIVLDLSQIENIINSFNQDEIIEAASFHGDIGENRKTLDVHASKEQAAVQTNLNELKILGDKYKKIFGMKFLVSAQGKTGAELLKLLKERINNTLESEMNNARLALWEITKKRVLDHPINSLHEHLLKAFNNHGIDGAQISIMIPEGIQCLTFGSAHKKTWFEMASLSKTVGSAFAMEYFKSKHIPLTTSVNSLFEKTNSSFRLTGGDDVTISHLMGHCALNLHYVNGVPANKEMPKIQCFLDGNTEYGYPPIKVINTPGEIFQYSGGGFIVLEHLIEALEKECIFSLTRPFLDQLGMRDFSFEQHSLKGVEYAQGFNDDGKVVEGTRKMFPAFAAGSMGTTHAMASFLVHLDNAYHDTRGSSGISHDTACQMLLGTDKGCKQFMGVNMGLGVFVGEAGPNKFAIHQGANDGFRCIYLHCFFGPDRGKGLVILCNGDLKGMLFNAEATQLILKELKLEGVDVTKFKNNFNLDSIPQEEVVNMGYKELIFSSFIATRPEPITDKGPLDPLASFNVAMDAKIIEVSNERFARAENLLSDHLPIFDPELFGKQGKVMDSWETVRHNQRGFDYLVFEMKRPSPIEYILLSTKYHLGNHAPMISLEALIGNDWKEILPKTEIEGHSEKRIKLEKATPVVSQIRVSLFPDGGFSRLGLYSDIPSSEKNSFKKYSDAMSVSYEEKIPQTVKPISIKYNVDQTELNRNWSVLKKGDEFNNAASALGAKIIFASNQHYSPAIHLISPFAPINMFDGLESARSRIFGHFEEVIVALAKPLRVHKIQLDFTYFVNNNPLEVSIEGFSNGKWIKFIEKENVKAFAGNIKEFNISHQETFEQIKVVSWPDGGMNRLKVFSIND